MRLPLFDFQLRKIDQIQPWGAPENPKLHWFGLSDGHYWLNVGDHRLFEYSNIAQTTHGFPKHCDYQVVRLYEDVLEIAPYALEVVPPELRQFIALSAAVPLGHAWQAWCALPDTEQVMELLDEAGPWLGCRTLDSMYLKPSTNICMWSDAEQVHIQWDNRDKTVQDACVWSAEVGIFSLERECFVNEVRSFHTRFMEQMAERVEQVCNGGLPAGIHIDLDALVAEQRMRSQPIDRNLSQPPAPTMWPNVIAAIQQLESLRNDG